MWSLQIHDFPRGLVHRPFGDYFSLWEGGFLCRLVGGYVLHSYDWVDGICLRRVERKVLDIPASR